MARVSGGVRAREGVRVCVWCGCRVVVACVSARGVANGVEFGLRVSAKPRGTAVMPCTNYNAAKLRVMTVLPGVGTRAGVTQLFSSHSHDCVGCHYLTCSAVAPPTYFLPSYSADGCTHAPGTYRTPSIKTWGRCAAPSVLPCHGAKTIR